MITMQGFLFKKDNLILEESDMKLSYSIDSFIKLFSKYEKKDPNLKVVQLHLKNGFLYNKKFFFQVGIETEEDKLLLMTTSNRRLTELALLYE